MILSASLRSKIRRPGLITHSHTGATCERGSKLTKRGKSNNQGPQSNINRPKQGNVLYINCIVRRQSINVCHYFHVLTETTQSSERKSCLKSSLLCWRKFLMWFWMWVSTWRLCAVFASKLQLYVIAESWALYKITPNKWSYNWRHWHQFWCLHSLTDMSPNLNYRVSKKSSSSWWA